MLIPEMVGGTLNPMAGVLTGGRRWTQRPRAESLVKTEAENGGGYAATSQGC